MGLAKDLSPSTYDCLSGGPSLENAAVDTALEGLRAVPATPDLAGASVELPRLPGSETRLRDAMAGVAQMLEGRGADAAAGAGEEDVHDVATSAS